MQLKRDTDFAIRILFSIKADFEKKGAEGAGLTVSELSARTGLPKLTVARLSEHLEEKGMLKALPDQPGAERVYYSANGFLGYSLLDVIEAVEGNCRIFSVFDKHNPSYRKYGGQLEKLENDIETLLANVPLSRLL